MLKTSPRITYKGITVVMSNPSRFDTAELLTGVKVNDHFKQECFARQGYNIMGAEVRVKEDKSPLLPNTKCLLLLGKDAFTEWTGNTDNTLGEVRGSVYTVQGIPAIPSYLPQDCVDVIDHESEHNELLQDRKGDYTEDEGKLSEAAEKRRHGITSRSNWRFWLRKDCAKLFRILANGGVIPGRPFEPVYRIWPDQDEIIQRLLTTKNETIYLDLETTYNLDITCAGLGFSDGTIHVVPFVSHAYMRAYTRLSRLLASLGVAIRDNTVVAHNGAAFDFFVLAYKYHIPISWNVYDTMLAQHRCFPEVEKSLGHCTSLWTYEPFHKDESCFNFFTPDQHMQLMRYCGKDVYTMMLIHRAQTEYASKIPGLTDSIAQVNESIRPYLTMQLTGMHYKEELRAEITRENDRVMTQCIRMSNILMGGPVVRELTRQNKTSVIASPAKCVRYFHDMLEYPIISKSQKTGEPSLGKKNIYKLALKVRNPVLDLCLRYRETAKESGSLKFTEWKDANGNEGVEKDEQ